MYLDEDKYANKIVLLLSVGQHDRFFKIQKAERDPR